MSISDVAVVSVPVSDQQKAKEFYVDKLGFELTRDDDSVPGIHWVQVTPKSGGTSLTLVNWFETMAPGSVRGLVLAQRTSRRSTPGSSPRASSSADPPSSSRGEPRRCSATLTATSSYSNNSEDSLTGHIEFTPASPQRSRTADRPGAHLRCFGHGERLCSVGGLDALRAERAKPARRS